MKKAFSVLMLLVAMLIAWPTRAQDSLTVANGTTTNSFVPVYGFYTDAYLRAQILYPSDSLVDMAGGLINSLTFYASQSSVSWGAASFEVKLGETTATSLSAWSSATLTTVYTGSLSISGNQMTVTFATPYVYTGGNLLIEVNNVVKGSYVSSSWYGVTLSGASVQGYNSSSWSSISATARDFLPKTTFGYIPASGCAFPINLAVSGVDSAQATITWSDTSSATAWRLYWYPTDSLSLMDSADVTDTTYTLYNLTSNTAYTVKVMTLCSNENSPVMTTTFRTDCVVTAIPYTTSFEDVDASMNPFCWTQVTTGGYNGFPRAYPYASNARTGTNYLEFETTTGGGTQIMALPVVDNISNLRLNFYAACTNHNFVLEAGVMEGSVFVPVDTIPLTTSASFNSSAYNHYSVYYSQYYGTGYKMALRTTGTTNYTLFIDDLTIDEIPPCPDPSYFTLDSVGTDWAALSWVDNGSTSSWVIEYDTVPFTPGTGTANFLDYPTDVNITLTGLDTGYTYYAYLHGDCGGDTTQNLYLVFSTLAADPATAPYSCGFEDNGTNGWEFVQDGQTNYWMVGSATNSGGNQSMYITNDGTANSYTNSSSSFSYAYRVFNLTEAGEYAYSFDWKANGESSWDYLRAWLAPASATLTAGQTPSGSTSTSGYVSTSPSGWISLDGGSKLNQQTGWQTHSATFLLSSAGTYQMIFMWCNDGSGGNNPSAAIDNITLVRQTCAGVRNLASTHVTSDSIVVSWQAGGSETIWLVSNGIDTVEVYDTTYVFDNLFANTLYNIKVWAICDYSDTSVATSISVRTACGTMTLPYSDDFNSYASNSWPACWTRILNSNSYPYITSDYGNCIQFGGNAYAISPLLPVPLNQTIVSFDLRVESTTNSGAMHFGYTTDPVGATDMVDLQVFTPGSTSTYYHYEFDLSNDTTIDSVYLVWRPDGSTIWYYWLDNLVIDRASTCFPIEGLRTSAVSNNFATIAWTDTAVASHVEYKVYIATTDNLAAAFDSVTVAGGTTSYTFTGLTGNTHYYVWVKGVCSDDDSRFRSLEFTTSVDCVPVTNVHATPDYYAFNLTWDGPTTGETATEYIVEFKPATATAWTTDSTTNTYFYVSGLSVNTIYDYRVRTKCTDVYSANATGSVQTSGCGRLITDGGTTNDYLPTYQYYGYSYTQQIYLNSELTGIDTITDIAFHVESGYSASSRPIVIYMGNTTQSSFTSTSNYIPSTDLQQVYSGTLSGSDWISFHLTTPFVRTAGSNLVVAVDDNTGSYVSSIPYTATATTNTRAIYFYQDGTDITPASPSASNSDAINYVNQIKLTNATCVIPDCGTPLLSVTDVQANQATIVWTPEAGQTYTVEYRLATDTAWTVADAANTTGTYTFLGLSPALDYVVRVSTLCSDLTLSGTVNFSTLCAPATLPYTEDFENYSGTYDRTCWTIGSTNLGSSIPYPTVVNLQGDPNKLLLMYNGAYAIMPRMDAPLNQLQIRFYFLQGADSVHFLMGLMDDPTAPISTMQVLDTIVRSDYDTTTYAINYTYRFDQLPDADSAKYIAFWDAFNDNYSFIDNLVVEYIPNCQPVTGLTASNVTTTSADIVWVDGNTSASGYIVEYGLHGFTPGTGTPVNATASPFSLTGLSHSTYYDAYVYTVCGTDTSIASQVVSFTTECDAITTLPYTMNFEGYMAAGSTVTNVLPTCWMTENTGAYIYYNTNTAQAPSQSYALQLRGSGIVVLPEMGIPVDSLMVSFHNYNVSGYGLIVGVVDNPVAGSLATAFMPVDTILFENGVNESMVASYLTDYSGTATAPHLALKAYGNSGTGVSHYIDNLTIDYIPSCIAPQRVQCAVLTNVSADIVWRTSQAPSYSVEYGLHGFTPGTGTTQTVTSRSISLTGLTPLTQYDVRLVSLCSATEVSDTTVFTFTTLRAAPVMTFPYVCDFADSAMAAAWEPVNGTQNNKWYLGSAAHYGTADNMAYYITDDNGTSNSYSGSASHTYVYRTFNMPAGSYAVSFNWQANGEVGSYSYDYLRAFLAPADAPIQAGYCPDGTTSSSSFANVTPSGWISLDGSQPLGGSSSWQSQTTEVSITTAGTYNLVFYWGNDGSIFYDPAGAIDNIEVVRNVCGLTGVAQDTVTTANNELAIRWNDNGAILYEVEYGQTGFAHGAGTTVTTTTNSIVLSGLDYLTGYDVYVRGICSVADTGRWYVLHLTTGMCDNALMAQSWDTSWTSSSDNYVPMGYSYYNYGYTQTIIDSAQMAGMNDPIGAFEFLPAGTDQGSYYEHMTVYMANVPESTLTDFIHPDSTHQFVEVITDADMCFSSATWQMHPFNQNFTWDGHSNVLVSIQRNHGHYASSPYASFQVHNTATAKSCYKYQDGGAYDINTVTGGTTLSVVGDMRFYACASGCTRPSITSVTGDYQSATMTWSGTGTAYEVAIKAVSDANWPAETAVSATTYTFTGLQPATPYMLRVRQDCTADSLGNSDWATTTFVTDSLPCLAPESLAVSDQTNATATFSWTAVGTETAWDIHVWNTTYDSVYTVTTNPATIGGLTAGVTYNAAVRALCGIAQNIEGEYGDTISFTTATCAEVTGLATSNVTFNSVTLTWTAVPGAQSYRVSYESGQLRDSTVVTTTSYTYMNLQSERQYTFYVRTVCGEGWQSETAAQVNATTAEEPEDAVTLTIAVNDESMGYVTINGSQIASYTGVAGEVVTLVAQPYEGYAFVSWSDGNAEATRSYTLPETDATLMATFRAEEGIDDVTGARCTLYPNPAKGATTVSVTGISGKVRIAVLDLSGREVLGETLECAADCEKNLDIEGLAEGAYFVRITSEANAPMVKKLIVR